MRIALWIVGVLAITSVPANAAETQFIGGLTIVSQAGACPEGDQVGKRYLARYRPRGVAQNGPHSDFNLFEQSVAFGYRLLNANFSTGLQKVQATRIAGGSGTDLVPQSTTFIKFATQTTVVASTKFINVEGSIKGFDSQPNCTVSFLFGGARRTDL